MDGVPLFHRYSRKLRLPFSTAPSRRVARAAGATTKHPMLLGARIASNQRTALGIGRNAPWGIGTAVAIVWGAVEVALFRAAVDRDPSTEGLCRVIWAVILAVDHAITVVVELAARGIHRVGLGAWLTRVLGSLRRRT